MIRMIRRLKKAFGLRRIITARYEDEVMTITWDTGEVEKYHGSSTVWYKMPMMTRCSTEKDFLLSEIWTYIEYNGNPYPTAHKMNLMP